MTIEQISILRHGFRLNWTTQSWHSPTGLPRDPPLSAFGEAQAREVAEYFLSLTEDQRPTAIFSSPYYRCLQTSRPIAKALELPIFIEHGLSEWFSPVKAGTGLHPRPGNASHLKRYFLEIDTESWSSIWLPSQLGENVKEIHDRAEHFLTTFIAEAERRLPVEKHARLLLVSHAATTIVLARALFENPELPLRVGCCTLTEATRDNTRWKVQSLATGNHLKGGIERDWGFEDILISNGEVVDDVGVPGTEGETPGQEGSQVPRSSL